jgi:hypothetical protein
LTGSELRLDRLSIIRVSFLVSMSGLVDRPDPATNLFVVALNWAADTPAAGIATNAIPASINAIGHRFDKITSVECYKRSQT